MKKKPCVITIQPNKYDINVETGDLHKLDVVDVLVGLQQLLARQIIEEAQKHVGDDPEAQARWIDLQRQNRENLN